MLYVTYFQFVIVIIVIIYDVCFQVHYAFAYATKPSQYNRDADICGLYTGEW